MGLQKIVCYERIFLKLTIPFDRTYKPAQINGGSRQFIDDFQQIKKCFGQISPLHMRHKERKWTETRNRKTNWSENEWIH
ncbi:hypothetical protein C4B60_13920 [Jeotgalibacillus proteolyticus]|uniref:Uncharacterized protein n=1 Tax=Jeotgalibacillus proteolyticus TaxID=2082395 RepID=A0A2S5G9H6_9BACL|nr:hypothetical protein C4B60_13920 [Jeotgalibacillus proteolyticus]